MEVEAVVASEYEIAVASFTGYYATLLSRLRKRFKTPRQRFATRETRVESRNLYAALRSAMEGGSAQQLDQFAQHLAWLIRVTGQERASLQLSYEMTAQGRRLGSPITEGFGLCTSAMSLAHAGQYYKALELAQQAQRIAQDTNFEPLLLEVRYMQVMCLLRLERLEEARELALLNYQAYERLGDTSEMAHMLAGAAISSQPISRELLLKALGLAHDAGDEWESCVILSNLMAEAIDRGDFDSGRRFASECIRTCRGLGDDSTRAHAHAALAIIGLKEGDLKQAREQLGQADEAAAQSGYESLRDSLDRIRFLVLIEEGKLLAAARQLEPYMRLAVPEHVAHREVLVQLCALLHIVGGQPGPAAVMLAAARCGRWPEYTGHAISLNAWPRIEAAVTQALGGQNAEKQSQWEQLGSTMDLDQAHGYARQRLTELLAEAADTQEPGDKAGALLPDAME